MKKILVADCGGTSCCWYAAVTGVEPTVFATPGFNGSVSDDTDVSESVASARRILAKAGFEPDEVYFYCAGCGTAATCRRIADILGRFFPGACIFVDSDLGGAARATLGDEPGVACILGTGASAGFYANGRLVHRVPSLGYQLGDEGSGAYIGKVLLVKALRRELPEAVTELFVAATGISEELAIRKVYRTPAANTYLGQFTRFISEHIEIPELEAIVLDAFRRFRLVFVEPYLSGKVPCAGASGRFKVGFVGSVAYVFEHQLRRVFSDMDVAIVRYPLEAIAGYHIQG